MLRNCGKIDPDNIEEYIAEDGYQALGKVFSEMTPEQVIDEMLASGPARPRRRRLPGRQEMAVLPRQSRATPKY